MIVRGHPLVLRQYYEVTNCNHCQTIIWGVSPQGFHCTGTVPSLRCICIKMDNGKNEFMTRSYYRL